MAKRLQKKAAPKKVSTPAKHSTPSQSTPVGKGPALPKWRKTPEDSKFSPQNLNKKMKKSVNYIRFIKVYSPDCNDLQGFAITCDGYGERFMTQPLYQRETPVHQQFLQAVDPVGWTFTLLNDDGSVFRKPDGINPYQALVVLPGAAFFEEGGVIDRAMCESFFNDTLMPAMNLVGNFRYENARPVFHATHSYREVQRWSDIMDLANLEHLLNRTVVADTTDPAITAIHLWYKASRANLYSVYNRGRIGVAVMTRYSFAQAHLDEVDFEILQAHNNQVLNVDDSDDDEDEPDHAEGHENHELRDSDIDG